MAPLGLSRRRFRPVFREEGQVIAMAAEEKAAKAKPEKSDKPKAEKPKSDKPAKAKAEKPAPKPKAPADPRYKLMRKFHGKFLPRGPLRDRHTAIMTRWNSGEDHGGVTVEELKSLFEDWKAAREKRSGKVKA